MAEQKQVTLLSLNSRRDPQKHAYYRGFKNIAYLTGYVNRIEANTIFLQMTNNMNLVLPVTIPTAVKLPRNVGRREALKMKCQVHAHRNDDGTPGLRVYARSFERPNILELPLRSAFDKAVPSRSFDDAEFKPYGSGHRASDACNQVTLAGMVAGINHRAVVIGEDGAYVQSGRVDILLRQDEDEHNILPIRYYGKLAERVAGLIKPGDFILASGRYRVAPIEAEGALPDAQGKVQIARFDPYIHIDAPAQPNSDDILYLADPATLPPWTVALHRRLKMGQRAAPKAAPPAPPAAAPSPPEAPHVPGVADVPDFERHPKWASLSEGDQLAARQSAAVRALLLN